MPCPTPHAEVLGELAAEGGAKVPAEVSENVYPAVPAARSEAPPLESAATMKVTPWGVGDTLLIETSGAEGRTDWTLVRAKQGHDAMGAYHLDGVLGAGGVGVVFSAFGEAEAREGVAIKVLQRAAASPENVARFRREVEAQRSIQSHRVARVLGDGVLTTGDPYLVMERFAGRDLGAELRARGALPLEEAVLRVVEICEGVTAAHAAGIVHRDLKPSNLFLAETHAGRSIKILDFGIAKWRRDEAVVLTRSVNVLGSPMYMSPEQLSSPHDADERSDVWSLGVVLYELVTGQTPFSAEVLPLLCARICTEPPRPFPSPVPKALADAILKCLSVNPDARFTSPAELGVAIASFAGPEAERIAAEALDLAKSVGLLTPPSSTRSSSPRRSSTRSRPSAPHGAAETPLARHPAALHSILPAAWRLPNPWLLAGLLVGSLVISVAFQLARSLARQH